MEKVILVNEKDEEVGSEEKLLAHQKGLLHRAFSIFLFNSAGDMLIHKRADGKYHSAGLWTNACCSHPRPSEQTHDAAIRRLSEELGLEAELSFLFSFTYQSEFDNGLTEHELDHVFWGISDKKPIPNEEEISDFKYVAPDKLLKHIEEHPDEYTFWFKKIVERVLKQTPQF
ncbi:isopentenyl-diphosphate Delta-isomerase [Reichenbachiella sp.]|uniref:isopentenyl-diphosphate Delta-isomerase n=1 Tax=Reichenbachiella sp. TaxID=2184521 RepID=UPI003BAFF5C7